MQLSIIDPKSQLILFLEHVRDALSMVIYTGCMFNQYTNAHYIGDHPNSEPAMADDDLVFYRGANGEFNKIPFTEVNTRLSRVWESGEAPSDIKVAIHWIGTFAGLFEYRYDLEGVSKRFLETVRASAETGRIKMEDDLSLVAAMLNKTYEPDRRLLAKSSKVACLGLTSEVIDGTLIKDDKDLALMFSPACSIGKLGRLTPAFVHGAIALSFKNGHPYALTFSMGDGCIEEYVIHNDYEVVAPLFQCSVKPWAPY